MCPKFSTLIFHHLFLWPCSTEILTSAKNLDSAQLSKTWFKVHQGVHCTYRVYFSHLTAKDIHIVHTLTQVFKVRLTKYKCRKLEIFYTTLYGHVIRGYPGINLYFGEFPTHITFIVWRIFGDKIGIKLVCQHCAFHNRVIPQGIKQDWCSLGDKVNSQQGAVEGFWRWRARVRLFDKPSPVFEAPLPASKISGLDIFMENPVEVWACLIAA